MHTAVVLEAGGLYQNRISEKETSRGQQIARESLYQDHQDCGGAFFLLVKTQMLQTKFYLADFTSSHRYQHTKKIRETKSVQCFVDIFDKSCWRTFLF